MLTEYALSKFRGFIQKSITKARYRTGSTWHEATINAVEILDSGTVRARLALVPGEAATINRVELLSSGNNTWAYQDTKISVTSQQTGVLYWFDFTIREEEAE